MAKVLLLDDEAELREEVAAFLEKSVLLGACTAFEQILDLT